MLFKNMFLNFVQIKRLLGRIGIRLTNLILPTLLSLGATFFEAVIVSVLIPLTSGIITMDFQSSKESFFLRMVSLLLPQVSLNNNKFIFIMLLASIMIFVLLKNVLQYAASLSTSYQIRRLACGIRTLIFNKYLNFNKMFFDRNNIGYLQNILMDFTNLIIGQVKQAEVILGMVFMLVVYMVIMFLISWKVTLFILIFVPLLNYILKLLIDKIRKSSHSYVAKYEMVSKKIFNILSCISLVKSYTNEDAEKKHFSDLSEQLKDNEFSIDKKQNLVPVLQEIVLVTVLILLICLVVLIMGKDKSLNIGIFLVYFYLLKRCQTAFNGINLIRTSFAYLAGPLDALSKILLDKNENYLEKDGEEEFSGIEKEIKFNRLSFSYANNVEVLKGLEFNIEKNKIVAIVGATGAGKTTIVNLFLRFYDPPAGSILVDGVDIRSFTLKSLRSHVAIVSQEAWLFNDTLRNNITYGLNRQVTEEELTDILKKARLYDYIMRLPDQLETDIGDRGVKLSGGEKQRVAIARALLKRAEILILDEATSSLDSKIEKLIQGAIDEMIRGRTTIVIAHRLSTIRNADKIIVIEEGCLVEEGSLNELLEKRGKFYDYWQEQKFY